MERAINLGSFGRQDNFETYDDDVKEGVEDFVAECDSYSRPTRCVEVAATHDDDVDALQDKVGKAKGKGLRR